jgi:hypothetical protein
MMSLPTPISSSSNAADVTSTVTSAATASTLTTNVLEFRSANDPGRQENKTQTGAQGVDFIKLCIQAEKFLDTFSS